MRIQAYTYEGGIHCPACARQRFRLPDLVRSVTERLIGKAIYVDSHGIQIDATDREGNTLHVVFDLLELRADRTNFCSTCGEGL